MDGLLFNLSSQLAKMEQLEYRQNGDEPSVTGGLHITREGAEEGNISQATMISVLHVKKAGAHFFVIGAVFAA